MAVLFYGGVGILVYVAAFVRFTCGFDSCHLHRIYHFNPVTIISRPVFKNRFKVDKTEVIEKLEAAYKSLCAMSEKQCSDWKQTQFAKECHKLREEYGIGTALVMALFYGNHSAQSFYRLPSCHISDGLDRTKKLFKEAVLRMKGNYLDKTIVNLKSV